MPIPDYQSAMLPLLRLAGDGSEHKFRDAVERLAHEFALTDDERSEVLPSGTAPLFDNRIGWARTYQKLTGLLASPKRGLLRITERGKARLAKQPTRIDVELLDQFEEFRAFRTRRREATADATPAQAVTQDNDLPTTQTPEDQLASAYRRLRQPPEAPGFTVLLMSNHSAERRSSLLG